MTTTEQTNIHHSNSESTSNTFFITHDINTANSLVNDLVQHKVSKENIGVIGERETLSVAKLPEANLAETSDVQNSVKRGAALGGATGLLAGLVVAAFPPAGVAVGGTALAAMTAGGAALGSWSASMIGVSENSELVAKFESELNKDGILVLADIDTKAQQSVMQQVAEQNGIPLDDFGPIQ